MKPLIHLHLLFEIFMLFSDSDLPSTCLHLKGQLRFSVFICNVCVCVCVSPQYQILCMNIVFVGAAVVRLLWGRIDVQRGKHSRCILTSNVYYSARNLLWESVKKQAEDIEISYGGYFKVASPCCRRWNEDKKRVTWSVFKICSLTIAWDCTIKML